VTSIENELLEATFTVEEVREPIFGSYAEGAPRWLFFFVLSGLLGGYQEGFEEFG
jgi:hypothetical protein